MKQINLKLPDKLRESAAEYVKQHGYRNIQELATESIREKIFKSQEYDKDFSDKEIGLIDELITHSIKKKRLISEKELNKILEK